MIFILIAVGIYLLIGDLNTQRIRGDAIWGVGSLVATLLWPLFITFPTVYVDEEF